LYKKVFWANLGKYEQNILLTPKKLPAPAPMMAKPVCLRCYKFLHAAKIHRKFCSPPLYTKQCTGRKAEFRGFCCCVVRAGL